MSQQRRCVGACVPAGLCSQDLVYGVHADSHNVNDSLSGLGVGQAVDAQRLKGRCAVLRRNRKNGTSLHKKKCAGVPMRKTARITANHQFTQREFIDHIHSLI